MSISFTASGSTKRTQAFLQEMAKQQLIMDLAPYAQAGADALASVTPQDTGLTAASWGYEIVVETDRVAIYWFNTNENEGANVAVLLQYGHATGTGSYITGIDYINPAIQPIFDQITEAVWKKVTLA